MRFYALTPVVVFHVNSLIMRAHPEYVRVAAVSVVNRIIGCGFIGVELFFVMSAFLLSMPFALHFIDASRPKPSLKAYFVRRLTRLQPTYLIAILSYFVLKTLLQHYYSVKQLAPHLLASILYAHNIIYKSASLVSVVTWSLEVEVQFYATAPLLVQVFRIRNRAVRIAVFCLIPWLVKSIFHLAGVPITGMSILGNIQYFIAGLVLADIYIHGKMQCCSRSGVWDAVGVAAWCLIGATLFNKWRMDLMPVYIMVAFMGTFKGPLSNRIARNPWLTTLGGMCYTIYLFHGMILQLFAAATLRFISTHVYLLDLFLQELILLPITAAVAAVLFLYVEQPFMHKNWPAKMRDRLARALPWSTQRSA